MLIILLAGTSAFDDNDPFPINNSVDHGTFVAGCISSSTNNNTGVGSIGWSIKLMGVNASDNDETVTDGYSAYPFCSSNGCKYHQYELGRSRKLH